MTNPRLENLSILAWIQEHGIRTETGEPLDMRSHLFLFDPYRDFSPKQVTYKAAQIGYTTMWILKSFWACKQYGMDAIYTLPTATDVVDFAGGKVNRMIANNPILQQYVKDRDTVEQKRVGDNVIYYRGTWVEKSALMISSDWNIHDEVDRSKQSIISQYASRLQHSEFQWESHFSNPSVEGNGVSRYWPLSDQKHWFILCKACKKEQYMDWPDSVDLERKVFQCKFCHKELSDNDRRVGRWVKKFKDREWSGYWIPLLIAPWVSASQIIEYAEKKSPEYFANFVLGLPYVGEGNKIVPDILWRNLTSVPNSQENVVIGVDVGLTKHFVVGNGEGIFYYGKTKDWEDIERLMARFPRSVAVFDAMPDLTEPRKLKEKYPGRVFLCHYARDRKTYQMIKWGEGKEYGNVVADRNRVLQLIIDEFTNKRIPLKGNQDEWMEYYSHWDTMYRVNEWEEAERQGKKNYVYHYPYRWESSTGEDHFCHATLYFRVGLDKFSRGGGKTFEGGKLEFPTDEGIDRAPKFQYEDKESYDWRTV